MKVFLFLYCLSLFIAACSATNSATLTNFQNQNVPINNENTVTTISNTKISQTLDCGNPNEYSFVVVENPNRKSAAEPLMPKDLHITVGDKVVAKIELPIPDSEAKNLSLNSVEKTKEGFMMDVDWGGWEYHYYLKYYFQCKSGNFFLYRIKKESIEGKDPGDLKNWIKKETKIEPNLPIEKFVMTDYLFGYKSRV
jgi:hypothetical protein